MFFLCLFHLHFFCICPYYHFFLIAEFGSTAIRFSAWLDDKMLRDQIAQEGIKIWDWTIESNDWQLEGSAGSNCREHQTSNKSQFESRIDARKAANAAGSSGDHRILRRRRLPICVYDDNEHFHLNFQKDHRL